MFAGIGHRDKSVSFCSVVLWTLMKRRTFLRWAPLHEHRDNHALVKGAASQIILIEIPFVFAKKSVVFTVKPPNREWPFTGFSAWPRATGHTLISYLRPAA